MSRLLGLRKLGGMGLIRDSISSSIETPCVEVARDAGKASADEVAQSTAARAGVVRGCQLRKRA